MRTRRLHRHHAAVLAALLTGAAGCGQRTAAAGSATTDSAAAATTVTSDSATTAMRDTTAGPATADPQPGAPNTLTAEEQAAGWKLLFDGRTMQGWRGYGKPNAPVAGWEVVDGAITRVGKGGDIVTTDAHRDFELALEWKVPQGGNSGVLYRVLESADPIYYSGPEMQVLDDAHHADGRNPLTSAGAAYGLYAPPKGVVKPAGEWNQARLLVRGNQVEHWLNGQKVVSYELGSADWKAKVAASKFNAWKAYGTGKEGLIGLQDHGDRVQFRSVKLRTL
jgi:hypothetical protein